MNWIKTEDRLPEYHETILFILTNKHKWFNHRRKCGYLALPKYGDAVFIEADDFSIFQLADVTHWMPYPELPETNSHNE